jgi:hypothetical protein
VGTPEKSYDFLFIHDSDTRMTQLHELSNFKLLSSISALDQGWSFLSNLANIRSKRTHILPRSSSIGLNLARSLDLPRFSSIFVAGILTGLQVLHRLLAAITTMKPLLEPL